MLATLGIVIDVLVIGVLVVYGIIGFKKGLFKTFLSLFNWTICLVVAVWAAKYVAGWLNNIYDFAGAMGNGIGNSLIEGNAWFSTGLNVFGSKDAVMTAINAGGTGVNGFTKQWINVILSNNNIDYTSNASLGQTIGSASGKILMYIITAILLFVVLRIIVGILTKILNKASETKIIGGLNKIFGCILGVVKAALLVFVFNIVLSFMSAVPFVNNTVNPFLKENTFVERYVYKWTDDFVKDDIMSGDFVEKYISNITK